MRHTLANFAILFGFIGFLGYLFLIVAGFLGCCAGITTLFYHKIVMFILIAAVVIFGICMYNNCCSVIRKNNGK